jgi:hypothetical protein
MIYAKPKRDDLLCMFPVSFVQCAHVYPFPVTTGFLSSSLYVSEF